MRLNRDTSLIEKKDILISEEVNANLYCYACDEGGHKSLRVKNGRGRISKISPLRFDKVTGGGTTGGGLISLRAN